MADQSDRGVDIPEEPKLAPNHDQLPTVPGPDGIDEEYMPDEPRFRPFASPVASGWSGIAIAFFVLSFYISAIGMRYKDTTSVSVLASVTFIIGGFYVFVCSMWAFAVNDVVHATIFSLVGSLFLSVGVISFLGFNIYNTLLVDRNNAHTAGTFWMAWLFIVFVMFIGTVRINPPTTVFFILLFVAVILMTGGTWSRHRACIKSGGWFFFFTSICCIFIVAEVVFKLGFSILGNPGERRGRRHGNRRHGGRRHRRRGHGYDEDDM